MINRVVVAVVIFVIMGLLKLNRLIVKLIISVNIFFIVMFDIIFNKFKLV